MINKRALISSTFVLICTLVSAPAAFGECTQGYQQFLTKNVCINELAKYRPIKINVCTDEDFSAVSDYVESIKESDRDESSKQDLIAPIEDEIMRVCADI